jgi:hypothetical protein
MDSLDLIKSWFSFERIDERNHDLDLEPFTNRPDLVRHDTTQLDLLQISLTALRGLSNDRRDKWIILLADLMAVVSEFNLRSFDEILILGEDLGYLRIRLNDNHSGRRAYLEITPVRSRLLFPPEPPKTPLSSYFGFPWIAAATWIVGIVGLIKWFY